MFSIQSLILTLVALQTFQTQPSHAIRGGEQSDITKEPWTVSVLVNGILCGGSILTVNFILTAAQCVHELIMVRYGSNDYLTGGHEIGVQKVFVFDRYRPQTGENNIAILETKEPMMLDLIKCGPIELPSIEFTPKPGTDVLVSGWGAVLEESQEYSRNLMAANFTVVDKETCEKEYGSVLGWGEFCAGSDKISLESGDAGDPAVQNKTLVGVGSFKPLKTENTLPSVFTSVGSFVEWIKDIIGRN
ncbi:Sar s 3 allergen (serine protease-like protein 7) [Sarcoptes scabiei]|uniref:Sar s 3 allergen (Serine protease-like protein 7) n=1 Tax=Sarcoptes scabiei TaxID=52283 RepID=A0A132ALB2_SARSC|nr:Sar s 3 allergen (serine protease-like protein 7) [Sarcoptes scabiei]